MKAPPADKKRFTQALFFGAARMNQTPAIKEAARPITYKIKAYFFAMIITLGAFLLYADRL